MTSTSNQIVDQELKHKIKQALKKVVVQEHSNPNKQMLKDMPGRVSLACPVCGDSTTDSLKKRGNLYWDTLQYHCYNCSHHTNLYVLLKDFGQNLGDRESTLGILDYIKSVEANQKDVEVMTPVVFDHVANMSIDIQDLKVWFGLKEIEPGDWIWFKLKERLLHNQASRFLWSPKDFRLWILNLSGKGKVIGAQTRKMKGKGPKYLTYDLLKILERSDTEVALEPHQIDQVTKISSTFGIMQIDFTRPVTVFEGPLDSMFKINSIALSSAGKDTVELDQIPTIRYMFDNDETGKMKMLQKLKRGRSVFMWQKFIKDNNLDTYNIKDLNDLMITCYEHRLDAHKKIDQYFTSSHLDLLYV